MQTTSVHLRNIVVMFAFERNILKCNRTLGTATQEFVSHETKFPPEGSGDKMAFNT